MEVISKGDWKIIKGKLLQMYGQLKEDDLVYVVGKEQELLGNLQNKLKKSKEEIIHLIKSIRDNIA